MYVEWKTFARISGSDLVVRKTHAFGPRGRLCSCCGLVARSNEMIHEQVARDVLKKPPKRCKKCEAAVKKLRKQR